MGPSAIRYAGVEERLTGLGHDLCRLGQRRDGRARGHRREDERARYLPEIQGRVHARSPAASRSRSTKAELPLVLGGDHSIALGTFGGLARVHGRRAA